MGRSPKNYTGHTWRNWVVIERAGTQNRMAAWLCRCTACGHKQAVASNRIRSGEGVVCEKCATKPPARRSLCTDEEFIRAWQLSTSVAEVARKLGGTKMQANSIAQRMRKHNIPLKTMPKWNSERYVELEKLAKKLLDQ